MHHNNRIIVIVVNRSHYVDYASSLRFEGGASPLFDDDDSILGFSIIPQLSHRLADHPVEALSRQIPLSLSRDPEGRKALLESYNRGNLVTAKPTLALVPLRFEEKLRQHLNLDDDSGLANLLKDSHVFVVVAGLLEAFLIPKAAPVDVVKDLEQQRQRGRRRERAIPKAVDALVKAAARYRDLTAIEMLKPDLADQMEQEAFRLCVQEDRWQQLHNEKRLGFKGWIFLVILEDFVKFWTASQGQPYSLTLNDLLHLLNAGNRASGWNRVSWNHHDVVADDLLGLSHFRANPRNHLLCQLAANYAKHLAATIHLRPFLIFRAEV
jgi:hypothetical protein